MTYTVAAWYRGKLDHWVDDFKVNALSNEEAFTKVRSIIEGMGCKITHGMEIKSRAHLGTPQTSQ